MNLNINYSADNLGKEFEIIRATEDLLSSETVEYQFKNVRRIRNDFYYYETEDKNFLNFKERIENLHKQIELKYGELIERLMVILNDRSFYNCPYCNHKFDERPGRKRKCPKCKEPIAQYRFFGFKGLVFLIKKEDEDTINNEMRDIVDLGKEQLQQQVNYFRKMNFYHRFNHRLDGMRSAGFDKFRLTTVTYDHEGELLKHCNKMNGKIFKIKGFKVEKQFPCEGCLKPSCSPINIKT